MLKFVVGITRFHITAFSQHNETSYTRNRDHSDATDPEVYNSILCFLENNDYILALTKICEDAAQVTHNNILKNCEFALSIDCLIAASRTFAQMVPLFCRSRKW